VEEFTGNRGRLDAPQTRSAFHREGQLSFWKSFTVGAVAMTQVLATAGTVFAQSGNFVLELNNASDINGSCRLTYVATNNTGVALLKTSYEVAIFDKDGKVNNLLVLEFGALPIAKTKVVQFDLKSTPCSNISRIVVNNVAECQTADNATADFCLSGLITSSKTDIKFGV
jgi:hypothetical protein